MYKPVHTICVCGAGTMGRGIAQVSALAGFNTRLFEVNAETLEAARASISKNLNLLVEKNKLTAADLELATGKLSYLSNIRDCTGDLIIEAVVENLKVKLDLFHSLSAINAPHTVFATNTSSLSITAIASGLPFPGRVIGMHFFNPAPLMKLVEIVTTSYTDDEVVRAVTALATSFGKIPVLCKDVPGFIVNRVARQFYLEALALAEQGIAVYEVIDRVLETSGFKMGPFRLMDLIGNDINLSVTASLYEAFDRAPRFKPAALQQLKVMNGKLGRKTQQGYYNYNEVK